MLDALRDFYSATTAGQQSHFRTLPGVTAAMKQADHSEPFSQLTPDIILTAVEQAAQVRCTAYCLQLNSYINRVYELQTEDDERLIVKFYRPDRWSLAALEEEHGFVRELADHDLPVVAPITLSSGQTLARHHDIYFAVYPKRSGRFFDEFSTEQWQELGRLIGRMHAIGSRKPCTCRPVLTPDKATAGQVDFLLASKLIPDHLRSSFATTCQTLLELIIPLFSAIKPIRIHGDCHFGNILHRAEESFLLIDFDDLAMGPAVQDFWLLLPGYKDECPVEIENFIDGYETFRPFSRAELSLIEPLRAMRYIHFIAWCAHQAHDINAAENLVPGWGDENYWRQEIDDLKSQIARIRAQTTAHTYDQGGLSPFI